MTTTLPRSLRRATLRAISASPAKRTFTVSSCPRLFIRDATQAKFNHHIASTKDKLILVDFYEDWCAPCKILSPLLEKLEADPSQLSDLAQPFDLITLNAGDVPELAEQFQIRAVPSVFAIKNGAIVGSFLGALPLQQIKNWYADLPEK